MTTVDGWVRTNKRAPGSPWRSGDPGQTFRAGPWHAVQGMTGPVRISGTPLSWCGRKPTSTTINVRFHDGAAPPAGERLCDECVRRVAQDRPRAFHGKGRRQA